MAFNYSPKIVTNGLVLYLDAANTRSYPTTGSTWSDLSRSGNNGTLTNGPTFSNSNRGGIVFDGSNDYVPLVNPNILNLQTLSVSIWFSKPNTTAANPEYLIRNRSFGWGIYITGTNLGIGSFLFPTSNSSPGQFASIITSNNYINLNQPTCATITFSNSLFSLYVNNTLVNTATTTSNSVYYSTPSISIGRDGDFNGNYLLGSVFNCLIYNRALTAQEVLQNYNATKTRFGLT